MLASMARDIDHDPVLNAVRVANIRELLKRFDSKLEFTTAVGWHPSRLSQMLKDPPRSKGWRPVSERSARHIETSLELPEGWLSADHASPAAPAGLAAGGGADPLALLGQLVREMQATDAAQGRAIEHAVARLDGVTAALGVLIVALLRNDRSLKGPLIECLEAADQASAEGSPSRAAEHLAALSEGLAAAARAAAEEASGRAAVRETLQRMAASRR